jgi:hypothetical protein
MPRINFALAHALPTLAASLLLISGCASPRERVAEHAGTLAFAWQTNVFHQAHRAQRELDWPTAIAELRANNLKLRQSQTELTNSQEAVRQIFRDLTPTLNLRAGVSKRLVDLPQISPDDVNFSADSFFNLPGLVSLGARLYVARLQLLRAETVAALVEREQLVELYKLFWHAQDVAEQSRQVQNQLATARAFSAVDPLTGQIMLTQTELRVLAGQQEQENLQQRVSDLLGSRNYRWVLSTNGLPPLKYHLDPLPISDTNRVAQLQLRLAAIELEAARAQLSGIKLRYWPDLNIFISSPPIYQRSFGRERWWDADEVRATADVFWWIDTRGHISRQVRQTQRQQAMQIERLRQESLSLINRLLFTQELLKSTQDKELELEQQLLILETIPPAQNYAALQKYSMDYQMVADQLRAVRRELAELNALFWFVDEAAWFELSPMAPLVASKQ